MEMSQYHYLPLAPSFFAILVGLFIGVLILQSLRYAYVSLGISPGAALFLLFASLVGSIFNIPIVQLAPEPVLILSKAPLGAEASSLWAQGGLAAAMGGDDDPALHLADTLAAGAGLCDGSGFAHIPAIF